MPKIYPAMTLEVLQKMYINGNNSLKTIGDKFGCCPRTVRNYVAKFGLPICS